MAYEIDFLAVGNTDGEGRSSRSGDAICARWGDLNSQAGAKTVIIVDAGFTSCGNEMVSHIKQWYGTSRVDYVFSSHPHDDHIQGLFPVLENLSVGTLVIHKPWAHAASVVELTSDDRLTYRGTNRRLRESFEAAHDLCRLAARKGIPVVEPFEGLATATRDIVVLGPSVSLYKILLAQDMASTSSVGAGGLLGLFKLGIEKAARVLAETWDKEALTEPPANAVEPLNNTSTVIHLNLGETTALLTADAGVIALECAADYANRNGIDLRQCTRIQVPHHGSKRNVGPRILDRIFGPVLAPGAGSGKTGMVSAARDGAPKHPSSRVTNAVIRRGASVCVTRGLGLRFASPDAPTRSGWEPAVYVPFTADYDDDDE